MFIGYLDKAGVDTEKLLEMYSMTPVSYESVYKDFSKYYTFPKLTSQLLDPLEVGARWLWQHKMSCLKQKPEILNVDEVVDLLDTSKSATALWNQVHLSKKELFSDSSFWASFVQFLHGYALGENYYSLFLAIQKQEIRPTEKIRDLKIRSIIVGSVYQLLLGHGLYADLDDQMSVNWEKFRTGLGMSFFNGDYDKLIRMFENKKHIHYADISKYDSWQCYYLQALCAVVADMVYSIRSVSFYTFLGSKSVIAKQLGIADFQMNIPFLRRRLIEDGVFGPVIMPDGVVLCKDTGECSGGHRTGHSNTDRYKIVEFTAASCYFDGYRDYITSDYYASETGDDEVDCGPDSDVSDQIVSIWQSLGAPVESTKVSRIEDLTYLSSSPVRVKYGNMEKWMPKVNSSKVIAGLCDKMSDRDVDKDLSRLASAIVLCHFTEDAQVLSLVKKQFIADHPSTSRDVRWWSKDQINGFYFGSYESGNIPSFLLEYAADYVRVAEQP